MDSVDIRDHTHVCAIRDMHISIHVYTCTYSLYVNICVLRTHIHIHLNIHIHILRKKSSNHS